MLGRLAFVMNKPRPADNGRTAFGYFAKTLALGGLATFISTQVQLQRTYAYSDLVPQMLRDWLASWFGLVGHSADYLMREEVDQYIAAFNEYDIWQQQHRRQPAADNSPELVYPALPPHLAAFLGVDQQPADEPSHVDIEAQRSLISRVVSMDLSTTNSPDQ